MVNVEMSRKRFATIFVAVALVVAAIAAVPAYAFYYVQGGDYDVESDAKGAIEVFCTVDSTAQGGTVWTGLIFVPADSTVETALQEALHTAENQQGIIANHDYSFSRVADYIDQTGGTWTFKVYHAESQKPGTHTTQDGQGQTVSTSELDSVTLQRFDQVVATLEG